VDTSEQVVDLITDYTVKLVKKGLVDQIIALLSQLNLEKEINLLHENRALGGPKHRRFVAKKLCFIIQFLFFVFLILDKFKISSLK
jgi:nuclear pore complex protein Nup205